MSKKNAFNGMKLSKFEDLFQSNETSGQIVADVQEIPSSDLHEFRNHPFKIRSDGELAEMIESIRVYGVLVPGIARERAEGGYEIVAGHTRHYVCQILGMKTMPMIIRDLLPFKVTTSEMAT